eukprot:m.332083 g.332083  ORF g.332083 m.332083 type:complete len:66 (+) comp16872_c0_seq1:644-841(+)
MTSSKTKESTSTWNAKRKKRRSLGTRAWHTVELKNKNKQTTFIATHTNTPHTQYQSVTLASSFCS